MSKEVDALVLIGHGHRIAQEPPQLIYDDLYQGLGYVRKGVTEHTEADRTALYAGEIFMQLGALMANRYLRPSESPWYPNPFREGALQVIDEISPFASGEMLRPDFAIDWPDMQLTEHELPAMFDPAIAAEPSITAELQEKWQKAQAVHAQRGTVPTMAYDVDALMTGFGQLQMGEIAPDVVVFDENDKVVGQSYDLSELADRATQAELMDMPYYQTFSITEGNNAEEMLASALEDLRLVSAAIRSS